MYEPAPSDPENSSAPLAAGSLPSAPQPAVAKNDPLWTGWEVIWMAFVAFFSVVVMVMATAFVAQKLVYRSFGYADVWKFPGVILLGQLLAYGVVFAYMYSLVEHQHGGNFWQAVRWNWPRRVLPFLVGGAVLSISLQALAHFLPMPKDLPIDEFFRTPREAWMLSLFGMTIVPVMEELFFRGFLYPVLARRLSMAPAIFTTALCFALIHAPQLARAWGPVLVIFLVGVVLTATRAFTRSVGASILVHMAYNGTISLLLFAASDGFRHLDKLKQ